MHQSQQNECTLGLRIPSGMSCREFATGIERFCADPKDFVSSNQVVEMAAFFGLKGRELKKVKLMASREETYRSLYSAPGSPLTSGEKLKAE